MYTARRLYSLTNIARNQSSFIRNFSNDNSLPIKKVGVIGLGLMGHGIAQLAAQANFQVVAHEQNTQAISTGVGRIRDSLTKQFQSQAKTPNGLQGTIEQNVEKVLSNLQTTTSLSDLADADLIIEAIVENLEVKRNLFKELGRISKQGAILSTNTSSFPVTECSNASGRHTHTIGLHYFNPAQKMKLVEVVRLDSTDPTVFENARGFVKAIGRTPISCKDTPGFIVNRLLVPYLAQAMLMLERGDATKEDIDEAMKLGAGYPMGPILLSDYVGLDTSLSVLEGWAKKYPNEPSFVVPQILKDKVKQGHLGRKTGQGFYDWSQK
eukprot:TRINITY_DN1112_c1_g2_i1.p1 TRINITY_DN1112_c1_g2~~TRINITY_DN1112_c1_g2_i1.p1  ORF type:complete len:324 (+),score=171.82 TRINITY_DN1112_c1_g2_i1:56-1027(+)